MEVDVLAGAANTIEQLRPALFVENNTLDRSRPLLEMLQSLNCVPSWHIRSYFNPHNFFGNSEVVSSVLSTAARICEKVSLPPQEVWDVGGFSREFVRFPRIQ